MAVNSKYHVGYTAAELYLVLRGCGLREGATFEGKVQTSS